MQVLGSQQYFQKPRHLIRQQSAPFETPPAQIQKPYLKSSQQTKKKRINTASKRALAYDIQFEDFKQNKMKQKVYKQLQQLDKLNYKMQQLMTPFSSVLNSKQLNSGNPSLNKSQQKTHESQIAHASKRRQQRNKTANEPKNRIEQAIEKKLCNITQNKRKSISYRIHIPPKQFNSNQQSKRNIEKIHLQLEKNNYGKQSNVQKEQEKAIQVSRQKSSQSFVIRKKINSNALQSQKPQKIANRLTYCAQKYRKERFIKEEKLNDLIESTNRQISQVLKSKTSPKHSLHPLAGQTKETQSSKQRDLSFKPRSMKVGKGLKVRVNKLIKAQQRLFSEESRVDEKQYEMFQKEEKQMLERKSIQDQKDYQKSLEANIQKQILCTPINIPQGRIRQQNFFIENIPQEKSIIEDSIRFTNQEIKNVIPPFQLKVQQSEIMKGKEQANWRSQRQTQNGSNFIKSRKGRIASIRAIKNNCKKTENDQKASFATDGKQSREIAAVKKKEKEPPCLTHKIKWGNTSKKKLNSDRIFVAGAHQLITQCSVEDKVEFKKPRYAHEFTKVEEKKDPKTTIQVQLQEQQTRKKPSARFRQVVGQDHSTRFSQQRTYTLNTTPKNFRNIDKMFTQTIQSKELIDCDQMLYPAGSKSLIVFQDPGISAIAINNDSMHIAVTPKAVPNFKRPSIETFPIMDHNFISPVTRMEKRIQDGVEDRVFEGNCPMESLQELFYELRSHKSIPLKTNDELKMDSLQEMFQE